MTSMARTVIDLARQSDLMLAIVVADAALKRKAEGSVATGGDGFGDLGEEVSRIPLRHGEARGRHVLEFADERSGSAGESISRVTMRRLGVPKPVLQQEFSEGNDTWFVDFWWPGLRIVGEFDGDAKYLNPEMRSGRSAAEVVLAEKKREDAIRRQVSGFVRWGWAEARSPRLLGARLAGAGLPISSW
ncbi:MAG TPA: hypothetical protein VNT53_02705 [Pseudolysinimonas sp.]|nr:hypothetical protein [Pseudolysinimonas sp.]